MVIYAFLKSHENTFLSPRSIPLRFSCFAATFAFSHFSVSAKLVVERENYGEYKFHVVGCSILFDAHWDWFVMMSTHSKDWKFLPSSRLFFLLRFDYFCRIENFEIDFPIWSIILFPSFRSNQIIIMDGLLVFLEHKATIFFMNEMEKNIFIIGK